MSDEQADAQIDDIGVIARVTPEHKVRLVDILKRKGHVVGMTGDGVNDAPALKRADIGIAMGITGTEVSKEAAAMILTDDNFATIVKAVELGRGLYDNLVKYIRFQMGVLVGFIVTFLGASILNIAGGVPFLPLQTLWVNFTTQVFQAIGLGYGEPSEGLMERRPRKPEQPILHARRHALVRRRRPRHGRRHARRRRRGRERRRRRPRAHDGPDDVRDREPVLLVHRARRAAVGLQPRHVRRPPLPHDVADVGRRDRRRAPSSGSSSGSSTRSSLTGNQWLICIGAGADRGRRRRSCAQADGASPWPERRRAAPASRSCSRWRCSCSSSTRR